jgi:hypothetical protein
MVFSLFSSSESVNKENYAKKTNNGPEAEHPKPETTLHNGRDSQVYEILDREDEWNVLDSPQMTLEHLSNLPDAERIEMLEKEVTKLQGKLAGEWNKKGADSFKTVKAALKIQSGVRDQQVSFCTQLLTEALKSRKDKDILVKKDMSDMVTEIKSGLDAEYGTHKWHVMIGRKMSFHLTSSSYLNFYFKGDDMTVVMFKAYQEPKFD